MLAEMNMPTPFPEPQPLLLTVDDFEALLGAGRFAETGKTELIEGVIVHMNAEFSRNTILRNELTFRFRDALRAMNSSYKAMGEPSVSLSPRNVPSPDIAIIDNPKAGRAFLTPFGVALFVEVSDTSLRNDLIRKRRLYARAGIPEYWVVGVEDLKVHRFWSLLEDEYHESDEIPLEGELRLITMPEIAIDGRGIL